MKHSSNKRPFKMVLLGAPQTGKTALTQALIGNVLINDKRLYSATVRTEHTILENVASEKPILISEVGGSIRNNRQKSAELQNANLVLFTITSKKQLENIKKDIELVKTHCPDAEIRFIDTRTKRVNATEQTPSHLRKINPFNEQEVQTLKNELLSYVQMPVSPNRNTALEEQLKNLHTATTQLWQQIQKLLAMSSEKAQKKGHVLRRFHNAIIIAKNNYDEKHDSEALKQSLRNAVEDIESTGLKNLSQHRNPIYQGIKRALLSVLTIITSIISLPCAGIYYGATKKNPFQFFKSKPNSLNAFEQTKASIDKITNLKEEPVESTTSIPAHA